MEEHRAQTEDIARQRLIWVKQLGQTTLDSEALGGPAFVSAAEVKVIVNNPSLSKLSQLPFFPKPGHSA